MSLCVCVCVCVHTRMHVHELRDRERERGKERGREIALNLDYQLFYTDMSILRPFLCFLSALTVSVT